MAAKIQLRRDTTANWEASEPVLSEGEIGFDTTVDQFKIGDGTSTWSELSYYAGSGGGGGETTDTPTLSLASSANELSTVSVTVTNYDASIVYDVTVTGGSINTSSHPWQWTLPAVSSNTTYKITITAQELGKGLSAKVATINVLAVDATADGVISVPSRTLMPENKTITLSTQEAGEENWVEAIPTVFVREDIELDITGSTSTTLKSNEYVDDGSDLIIKRSDGAYEEIKNASVTFSDNEIASTNLEEITTLWDEGTANQHAVNGTQQPQYGSRRFRLKDGTYCTFVLSNAGAYRLAVVKHDADDNVLDTAEFGPNYNVINMFRQFGVYDDIFYMSDFASNAQYCWAMDMKTLQVVSDVKFTNSTTWTEGRAWFNGESWLFNDDTYVQSNGTLFGDVYMTDGTSWANTSGYMIDAVSLGGNNWLTLHTNGSNAVYAYVFGGKTSKQVYTSLTDTLVDISNMGYGNTSFQDHSPVDFFHVYGEKGISYAIRDDLVIKTVVPQSIIDFPYSLEQNATGLRDRLNTLEDSVVMKSYESGVGSTINGYYFETNTRNMYLITGANLEVIDHDLNSLSTSVALTTSTTIDYSTGQAGHIYTDSDGYLIAHNTVNGDRMDRIKTDKMNRYPSTFEVDITSLSLSSAPSNAYVNPVNEFKMYASVTKVEPEYKPYIPASDWDGVNNTVRIYPSIEFDPNNLYAYASDGTREKLTGVSSTEVALTIDDGVSNFAHSNLVAPTTGSSIYGWSWLFPQNNSDIVLMHSSTTAFYINRYNSAGTQQFTQTYNINIELLAPNGYTAAEVQQINCLQVADDKIVFAMTPASMSRFQLFTYDPTTDTVDTTGVIVETDAENTGSNAETGIVSMFTRYGKLYVLHDTTVDGSATLHVFDIDTLQVTDTILIDTKGKGFTPSVSGYAQSLFNVIGGKAVLMSDSYIDGNVERTTFLDIANQNVSVSNYGLGFASGVDGLTFVNDSNETFVYYVDHGSPFAAGIMKYSKSGEVLWLIERATGGTVDLAGIQPVIIQLQPDLYLFSVPQSSSQYRYVIFEDTGDDYVIHYDASNYVFNAYTSSKNVFITPNAEDLVWMDTNNDIAYTTGTLVKDNYYTKAYDLSYDALSLTPVSIRQEVTPTVTPDVDGVVKRVDGSCEISYAPYTSDFREIEIDVAYDRDTCQLIVELNKEVV